MGALGGAAVIAALDNIVFHQVLGRHHFYDRSVPAVGLLSDGPLHPAAVLGLIPAAAPLGFARY
ncbi:DUF2243 domain-containing protein [Streptomyces sp. NPDC020472]|uniref:DUF2243 domain-containing protein n=1 Tax=Streptomyces sp. NPDC020472 TaxID=3365075 RepID=UPI003791C60D